MTFDEISDVLRSSRTWLEEDEYNAQVIDFIKNEDRYYLFDQIEMNDFLSKILEIINDNKS